MINLNELNQYITTNSLDIMKYLPKHADPFIDLIVTSPPYWDMKQYGDVEQTGYQQSYNEYLADIEKTFKLLYKLSKDTATLYVNSDTIKRNGQIIRLPDDIATKLENIGWIHKDVIIWDKGKTLPWSHKGQMRNTFEYIHMFVKSEDYKYHIERIKTVDLKEWWVDYPERYSPEGKVPDNIWEFNIPTQGSWGTKRDFGDKEFRHACPFPPRMMARLIKLSSDVGDVVFDPYAGTGILLAVAEKLNRRYLGIDANPDYKEKFEHVTKPLIEERIVSIKEEYEHEEELKALLNEAIYKLRVLKVPKVMIKSFAKDQDVNFPFIGAIALEKELNNEEMSNKNSNRVKIGKVKYYFISNSDLCVESTYPILLEMSKVPPFSKYGLYFDLKVISVEEAINLFSEQDFYFYSKGVVNDSLGKITFDDIKGIIQDKETNEKYSNKEIPPIFSNVNVTLSDYEEILPERYIKRND